MEYLVKHISSLEFSKESCFVGRLLGILVSFFKALEVILPNVLQSSQGS
ncbi:MAG: hypothetical protein Q8N56_02865 [bacterium]|nr:hypothetical protein [bacterium]